MAFVIDDAFLPATLTAHPMTDEEFARFCAEHPDLFFEMTAEGELIVMPPNFSLTSIRNREMTSQLDPAAAEAEIVRAMNEWTKESWAGEVFKVRARFG